MCQSAAHWTERSSTPTWSACVCVCSFVKSICWCCLYECYLLSFLPSLVHFMLPIFYSRSLSLFIISAFFSIYLPPLSTLRIYSWGFVGQTDGYHTRVKKSCYGIVCESAHWFATTQSKYWQCCLERSLVEPILSEIGDLFLVRSKISSFKSLLGFVPVWLSI